MVGLYGVTAFVVARRTEEIGILAGGIAVILAVSIAAGIVPALRAMRVDPILALRHE